ncbi:hypothetical protein IFM89_030043 [Coptis chinensis]|uniref:Uncharacterized protein n=1 Tax=Coptis chinensis TaxID=261450 RepID=A0A835IQT0_9MAGN|nr:hypothetical protein IFM89_030043 [Coptis chinensis]
MLLNTLFMRKTKSKILIDDRPNSIDPTYEDWMASNSMVLTWLWKSTEPKILTNVQFLPMAKWRKRLEHGEFVSVAKESSVLLSTPSNRGGRGSFGGGRSFNGRGARGNFGFGRGNRGGFGGRCGRGDRYDDTDERKCTHCGKDGHTEPFGGTNMGRLLMPIMFVPIPVVPCEGELLNLLPQPVVPIPVVPCEEVPPSLVVPSEEKVTNIEFATVTTVEPALNQLSFSLEAPSVCVVPAAKQTRTHVEPVAKRTRSQSLYDNKISNLVYGATKSVRHDQDPTARLLRS